MYFRITLWTSKLRNQKEFIAPEWFKDAMPDLHLDGELFAGREFFQYMGTVRKKVPVDEEWKKIKYMVYDMPEEDNVFGERIKKLEKFLKNETFMLTYGDGVSDIDLSKLESFHRSHGKMVTVTAVHPGARFGELEVANDQVLSFQEKPQVGQGWINGGFFIIELFTSELFLLQQ